MLLLFDIDATLLVTARAGVHAMQDAGRALYGPSFIFPDIDFAGRLDPLIFNDLFHHNNIEPSPDNHALMRGAYVACMTSRLTTNNTARALPGVLPLISTLAQRTDSTLALLTGNFAETGLLKLRSVGLDPALFPIQVWGDLSPHNPPARNHLVPVAFDQLKRHAATRQPPNQSSGGLDRILFSNGAINPRHVLVIGDTPHDVACAKAHNCRSLAVATGLHTIDQLHAAGADHVVKDLSDTAAILKLIYE